MIHRPTSTIPPRTIYYLTKDKLTTMCGKKGMTRKVITILHGNPIPYPHPQKVRNYNPSVPWPLVITPHHGQSMRYRRRSIIQRGEHGRPRAGAPSTPVSGALACQWAQTFNPPPHLIAPPLFGMKHLLAAGRPC